MIRRYLFDEVPCRIIEKPFHAAIGIVGTDFAAIGIVVIGSASPGLCFLIPGFRMDLFGQAAFAVIFFDINNPQRTFRADGVIHAVIGIAPAARILAGIFIGTVFPAQIPHQVVNCLVAIPQRIDICYDMVKYIIAETALTEFALDCHQSVDGIILIAEFITAGCHHDIRHRQAILILIDCFLTVYLFAAHPSPIIVCVAFHLPAAGRLLRALLFQPALLRIAAADFPAQIVLYMQALSLFTIGMGRNQSIRTFLLEQLSLRIVRAPRLTAQAVFLINLLKGNTLLLLKKELTTLKGL